MCLPTSLHSMGTTRTEAASAPVAMYSPEEERPETERSPDDNKDYVKGGEGDYIEETHQHFVLLVNDDGAAETALIAMKSTQLKKSRKWNSMMMSRQIQGKNGPFTPPRFGFVYNLKTTFEENSKGSWHGWEMSVDGPTPNLDLYNRAKSSQAASPQGTLLSNIRTMNLVAKKTYRFNHLAAGPSPGSLSYGGQ